VTDAALDQAMLVFARELLGVGLGRRVGGAIGIAFHADGGHADAGQRGELSLDLGVLPLAFSEAQAPAVGLGDDGGVVGVVEGGGAAIISGVVEVPLRRGGVPDQLRELAPVRVVAGTTALGSVSRGCHVHS